ncbi:MAG: hypothetical protein GTO18_15550 [Anaerolineales bacterium]|nr:hypothetical protein [Anaerolineales bacterium]
MEDDFTYIGWVDPSGNGYIDVYVEATGYTLDGDSFLNYTSAYDEQFGANYDGFEVLEENVDEFGALVVDYFVYLDGVEYVVRSIYYQESDVIYTVDFWAEVDAADSFMPVFDGIWQDMAVNPEAVSAEIDPFSGQSYEFYDDQSFFSFNAPYGWAYSRDESSGVAIDSFQSPDMLAFFENIRYDEGYEITKGDAGQLALELLRESYTEGIGDIKIIDDEVMSDESERLTWYSESGGYSGVSFFETRGTTFLMLSYVAADEVFDLYGAAFDNLLATYYIP